MPIADDHVSTARQIALTLRVVSAATISNWTHLNDRPLACERIKGRTLIRWVDLLSFVDAHQELPAAAKARATIHAWDEAQGSATPVDLADLLQIAGRARAAAVNAGRAARTAAVRERDAATKHLEVVEDLVSAITALDAALALALGQTATPT